MWILTVVAMLAGGLLAASNLIVAKKPNAKELIDELTPYQGVIGVVMLVSGIMNLINVLRLLGVMSHAPGWTLIYLVTTLVELALGFLLSYSLIDKYVLSRNPQAAEKGQQVRAKLAVYQGPLGLVAIGLVLLFMLMRLRR